MKKYRILVAGAGIGGLTAASCLAKAGHHVEIYEQAPQLAEIGAGIQISANAMHVLRDLGLEQAIVNVGVAPGRLCVPPARHRRGHSALLAVGGAQAAARRALHAASSRRPARHPGGAGARGRSRTSCGSITRSRASPKSDDGVDAALRERRHRAGRPAGRRRRAEVRGGAPDRRRHSRAPTPATPRGGWWCLWRSCRPSTLEQVMSVFMGPGGHVVCYYLRGGELLNFVGPGRDRRGVRGILDRQAALAQAQGALPGLASGRSRPSSTPPTRTSAIAGRCSSASR